jgi:DNA-binding SARP family transcriptional activator
MEPRFQLRCLGEPILVGPDGQPIRFKVRKHLALLVYLAVESRSRHRRDHLAELLWANLPEAEGRHSLATALSMLRARFGRDVVEAGRDDLRWAYTRLDLDLDRLARGSVLGDEVTPALDVAGFLDGFEVPAAAEFMLWRERQRARWLPLVRDALIVLIDRARRTGDSRQIEYLADRMLALDDLSEEAVRAKMEARAFAGDRLTALKIFEAWRERLDEELGAMPSPLVEGMALRLRKRGWERSAESPIPSVRTDQWKDRPFIGRGVEYRALYEGWERTQRGEPGHALVVGESGIGKSTLVERLTTAAGLEGASVCRVQCYELEREIPYAAVGGLIRGLLDRAGASAVSPETLAELARTVPEVRRRFPHIPQAADSEGETARIRLAEAMHQLVSAVAEEHPLILVVDDHHLADDASLAVLHLIMRRSEHEPLMVILVARPGEMGASPQAARLKAGLPRLGACSVELPPLTEAESDQLIGSLIPSDVPQPNSAVRRALVQAARGYPMVLELLCKDWQIHGERSLALALDAMTADPAPSGAPMEAYRQLHERIIESLDPVTRNVLNLSAILGHRLNDVTMYNLADLTVGQTMAGMSQLTGLRVLRDGGDGLEFINELIRAHAYVSVPSAVRRVLHGNIADRLIEAERRGTETQGLEVAWHCVRSGREEEAAPYLLKGARQAIQRGAPGEAERGLQTGLPILKGENRSEGLLLLAESLQEQYMWTDSLHLIEASTPEIPPTLKDRLYAIRVHAQHHLGMVGSDNLNEALTGLLGIARSATRTELRVTALRVASRIAYMERSEVHAHSLVTLAEELEKESKLEANEKLAIHYSLSMLKRQTGDRNRSLHHLQSGALVARTSNIANSVAQSVLMNLGAALCGDGNYEAALDQFKSGYKMGEKLRAEYVMALAAANQSLCYGRLGAYDLQIQWAASAQQLIGDRFVGYRNVQIATNLGFGYALSARMTEALSAIDFLEHRLPSSTLDWIQQGWQLNKADVLLLCGKGAAAHKEATRGLTGAFQDLQSNAYAGPFARWLATLGATQQIDNALARVESLFRQLENYDAIDQVEISAARLMLLRRTSRRAANPRELRHLRELCLRLPPPALAQISLLGLRLAD